MCCVVSPVSASVYNGTKLIKSVKKAQHLDLDEYIVIKKECPAMNCNQSEGKKKRKHSSVNFCIEGARLKVGSIM